MKQLTISAMSTESPQALMAKIMSEGLDLDRVEQIDFAGLQLLIATYLESRDDFDQRVRGRLPTNVIGSLLEEGGAQVNSSASTQPDLAPLWSQICE
ncbi:MAG: hypothetical protein AAF184_00380 [Pseudomonadota bacterium]